MEVKELSGKEITTIGIGGHFPVFFPENERELLELIYEDFFIIGGGSNLVLPDKLNLKLISLSKFKKFYCDGDYLFAQAGVRVGEILNLQIKKDFSIFEFLAGVPGVTVGGAVYQNAGAFGRETAELIESIEYIDEEGKLKELSDTSGFGYRKSPFSKKDIIISVKFKVEYFKNVKETIKSLVKKRLEKHPPFYLKTAGSTFKNPENRSAGFLIESAGLKGFSVGDIQISKKHANFLINRGRATFSDFCKIVDVIKNRVFNSFGVELELEVKIPGFKL
ncbi:MULTISPECIES: UDP-N-acetylmuramate dehydrogenase [unclassified Desulfurobacterium]|uniref:UDP-N-acetylmuramate dehydrogenase n=1 Tax=Desulfurobacterium sp. TC5-1 TaxID=1158318 RepID=UPI0003B412A0|nr:UDP-N-acetylmuramate dehydrogenase [Desulfurobacterium sp. TC5-1]